MLISYPQELLQKKCQSIVKETLKEKYVGLSVKDFILREGPETAIECNISFSNDWEDIFIAGKGDGPVDALYTTMINCFSPKFISLKSVSFDDFVMEVKFKKGARKSASPVKIKLSLTNGNDKNIYFSSESHSMVAAAISVVTSACEYLINAELTILQLRDFIADARERERVDLMDTYIEKMVNLVGITTYEEVLEKC
jgi:hypothetical protein